MSFTLYDALVPSWLQILDSVLGLMGKAETHCVNQQLAPAELIRTRLAQDMYPLGYQVKATVVHSIGALEGARLGAYVPDRSPWPDSFAGLCDQVSSAIDRLSALDRAEVDGIMGRDLRFEVGSYKVTFVVEEFLLSFSQPNFYFHSATAYDILRAQGIAIGKIDYLGRMRHRV